MINFKYNIPPDFNNNYIYLTRTMGGKNTKGKII